MRHYLFGLLTGLIVAGSVAGAQWVTPQDRQQDEFFQQLHYGQQLQQNSIQQQILRELQKPCY